MTNQSTMAAVLTGISVRRPRQQVYGPIKAIRRPVTVGGTSSRQRRPSGRWSRIGFLLSLISLLSPGSFAMEMHPLRTCSGTVLRLRGEVKQGDYLRLQSHLKRTGAILGFDLSSYGGDFEEGLRIADLTQREKLTVYVSDECDSACADIFFAATKRYFGPRSKIGVHSISNDRDFEDAGSKLLTMKLARLWAKRGVPNSTIGKMVITRPDEITYLDQGDLSALDASVGNPFATRSDETEPTQQEDCAVRLDASDKNDQTHAKVSRRN